MSDDSASNNGLPPGWTIERYDEFARENGGLTFAQLTAQNEKIQAMIDSGEIQPAEDLPELDSDDPDNARDPNEIRDERDEATAWVEAHPEAVRRHARRMQRERRQAQADVDGHEDSAAAANPRRRSRVAPAAAAAAAASAGAGDGESGDGATLTDGDLREVMDAMGPTEAAIDERVAVSQGSRMRSRKRPDGKNRPPQRETKASRMNARAHSITTR